MGGPEWVWWRGVGSLAILFCREPMVKRSTFKKFFLLELKIKKVYDPIIMGSLAFTLASGVSADSIYLTVLICPTLPYK